MNIALLGSGRGSNAEAVLKAYRAGQLGRARPECLLSDRADSRFLTLGEAYGVPAQYIDPGPSRATISEAAEAQYIETLMAYSVDLIVLAGFMRILKKTFINAFPQQIINLHPSLLPSFKGLDAIGQAYDYGVKITGCTVHYVTPSVDAGPVIDQRAVRIEDLDTRETLESKIHQAEHQLLVEVIARLSQG